MLSLTNAGGGGVHEACTRSTAVTTSRLSPSAENYQDGGQRSTRGAAGFKVRRQECEPPPGMVFQSPCQPFAVQQVHLRNRTRSQRPSDLDNDQAASRGGLDNTNYNLYSILCFAISDSTFSVVRRFEGKTREDRVGHRQDPWASIRERFDGCSSEALRVAHREMKTVQDAVG